jgi:hypothetical protein
LKVTLFSAFQLRNAFFQSDVLEFMFEEGVEEAYAFVMVRPADKEDALTEFLLLLLLRLLRLVEVCSASGVIVELLKMWVPMRL